MSQPASPLPDQQQLQDILALNVLPHLPAKDVQALGQTCTLFRQMIATAVPGAVWQRIAVNTFPGGDPLCCDSPSMMPRQLQALAAAHADLHAGRSAATEASLPATDYSCFHAAGAINHAGTAIIALHTGSLVLRAVGADRNQGLPMRVLWTLPAPESTDIERVESSECRFVWAPDDSWVAAAFIVRDYMDDRARFNENGWFEVVYAVDVASQQLQAVTHTHAIETLCHISISPDSCTLLLAWQSYEREGFMLELYARLGWERIQRLHAYLADPDCHGRGPRQQSLLP